ncbi:MAG TPA: ABC transporter ATP-binding protein [Acidimicrobiia bacterium]|jgi:ATP-binding cassette subfamily B protein
MNAHASPRINTWRLGWRLWKVRPVLATAGSLAWIAFHTMPFFVGLVLQAIFDSLSGATPAGLNSYGLIAVLAGVEAARWTIFFVAWVTWMRMWEWMSALLRANMLSGALFDRGPAADRLPQSAGEAVTRFRDDVEDVVWFVDIHLDLAGGVVFAVLALSVMSEIDPLVTLVAIAPLVAVLVGNRILTNRMRGLRRAYRESTAVVTSFLGELFANTLSVKATGAEARVIERLRVHNRRRNRAAIRDHVGRESLNAFNAATVEVAIGVMLLVAAPAMRRGEFTVGDLVLFTTYLDALSGLPRRIGRMLAYKRHAAIAVERMQRLVDEQPDRLPGKRPLYLTADAPPVTAVARDPSHHLTRLEIDGLTVTYGSSGRGVRDVRLTIDRGTVTVVAGEVGSGKSTLVRALLGLVPRDRGEIRWNGESVDDPGSFLVPPRCAYVAQVPRLFSESLEQNVVLGTSRTPDAIDSALRLAVLEDDVADMPDGLRTILGPRGVRLSGGQLQRTAAARAFVRETELLVVDDPSSALDVETEERMWSRLLAARERTLLVVSNRREVVARADQVLVLDDGDVVLRGVGADLLGEPGLQQLWAVPV